MDERGTSGLAQLHASINCRRERIAVLEQDIETLNGEIDALRAACRIVELDHGADSAPSPQSAKSLQRLAAVEESASVGSATTGSAQPQRSHPKPPRKHRELAAILADRLRKRGVTHDISYADASAIMKEERLIEGLAFKTQRMYVWSILNRTGVFEKVARGRFSLSQEE